LLDGTLATVRHQGSAWARVDDAAMSALRRLSGGSLELSEIRPASVDEDLKRNAAATKRWYARAKAEFPSE
jgi:hypothetical protein